MQCPKDSTCNLATSAKVKLLKLFKLKLLTAAILSKIHTVHPTCPSDTDTSLHKMSWCKTFFEFLTLKL